MPPKADPKAKAKAKGKAAAARRPSQAKVQKPGKKGVNLPVEIEIKTLDTSLGKRSDPPLKVGGIEVVGQHNLSRILLESIVALPFVHGFSKVRVRRISYYPKAPERLGPAPSLSLSPASARSQRGKQQPEPINFIQIEETRPEEVDCPGLFLALALGVEAAKPLLIRTGPKELLEEEVNEMQDLQDAYGIWASETDRKPEVVTTRHKHSIMTIPLAGGRCLLPPLSETALEDVNSFTKIFTDAISAPNDSPDAFVLVSRALRATQHVCCSVLLQPMLRGCTEQVMNLSQVFSNVEDIMLGKTHPELSVDYYDGLGANAIGLEKEQIDDFRGGPTSDGVPINELNKMVFELVPGMKQTRPTEFLAWFHSQMQQTGNFWNLKALYSNTAAPIDFDAVLQDEDGHAFLAPCSSNAQFFRLATLRKSGPEGGQDWKHRHIFSRMARWLLSGVLLHSPIYTPADLKWLRELCMILAAMPEDLSTSPPPPPDAASAHVRFAWSFARRCIRCLRWHHPMMVNGKLVHLPQAGHQMLWALLDAAIELVPAEHTKSYPERKRLALWASLCFAIRLAVSCKKMDETGWLADRLKVWGRFDDGIDLEGLAAQVYVTRFGVQESWSKDPVSKETRSVFVDDLPWEVMATHEASEDATTPVEDDVKTEYPGDELEASPQDGGLSEASPNPRKHSTSSVAAGVVEELTPAQTALKDLEPSMGRQTRKAWETAKRLVVTGGIGQGKRAITQNIMADLTLEHVCNEVSRFPLRLKFEDLQKRTECADAIQAFAAGSDPATAACCAWERLLPPPWQGRFNHQVICVDGKVMITGGVSTQSGKQLSDAWISSDGVNWEDLPPPPWPARSSHQVVWWEDRLILLGGLGEDDRRFRDAWQTTDFGLTWQELPCPKWSGRSGHRCLVMLLAVKAPQRPYLVLMGGSGAGNKAFKDVWVSDSGGFSWTELEGLPCAPRWNFHVAHSKQCLWITGGEDENHCFNDCWVLHGCHWNPKGSGPSAAGVSRWKTEAPIGEDGWRGPFTGPWCARTQHQVIPFRGQMALFGGSDDKHQVLFDAWVSQDGSSWQSLPYFAWAQAAGRAGHQVLTLDDGRSMVFGGFGGGRDILRSRLLAVVIESVPDSLPQEEGVVTYLNRLMEEPGHLVLCVTSIPKLQPDAPPEGAEGEGEPEESVYSLLHRWKFQELHVKPLEEAHLRKLCRRWTHGMELAEKVEEEILLPDNYDLVNSPLMAIMVLRALAPRRSRDRHAMTRCQLYEHMFKRIFQSQQAVKAYDDSEFPALHKQGMATACCELAYEGLGKRSRCIKSHELQAFIAALAGKEVKVEPIEKLVKTAHAGQLLLLEDYQQGGLRFRYPSMQDYLAAQCAWLHLMEGKGLPPWLVQENAAGNVSEEVTSCAKFFCLQAEGKEPLKKEMLLELREGLAFLLQTMCKAGNALAIRCLLGIAAAGGRQQLMAMHSQSGNHPTGLHLAAIHGHKDVVETLLALAPEPMQLCLAVNSDGMAPLHCAARDGHEATARALLQRAPDGFALLQMPQKSSSALRPLHWAAKQGHVDVVKCFLEFAPKPAVICVEANSAGNTALHFAAFGGHTVTCHALLTHAGPPSELSDRAILLLTAVNRFDRQTALHIAADRGERQVVDTLLQAAPDKSALLGMSDKLGQTALHLACERGHGAVVRKLLSFGDAQLVAARERITGQTALHMAAESGHTEAVRAVLEASPSRETSLAVDRGARNTALHLAAERGHLATMRTLVELCPDTEHLLLAQEKFAGQTALHLAAGAGHSELCRVMLELAHGLSSTLLSTQDKSGGFTPLQLACEKGHAEVIEVLLEGDPDKAARLKETLEKWSGFTALHLVAYRGHEEAAKVMLRLAPDKRSLLSFKDERGRTAGDLALERGRRPVASLLSES